MAEYLNDINDNYFVSSIPREYWGSTNHTSDKWIATSIKFRSGSENTVDDERFDLEM